MGRHGSGEMAQADGQRWPLWLPVALGCGMALYFSLPVEPSVALAGWGALAALALRLAPFGGRGVRSLR